MCVCGGGGGWFVLTVWYIYLIDFNQKQRIVTIRSRSLGLDQGFLCTVFFSVLEDL